ncbi:MAG: efflux RND transporter permease subunit [Parachlamydiales bacterium]
MLNLSKPFIERPVMTTLVMLAILFFGVIAFTRLPVSDLPRFEVPTILVTALNPGSDAATMAATVAIPLEQQIMQTPGIREVVSTSNAGVTQIGVFFELGRSEDGAATDVQAAIQRAAGNLPPQMPNPPTYQKYNPAASPVLFLALSSDTQTMADLYDYANTVMAQQISIVDGVAQVQVYGSPRAVRIKLNPDKMASMGLPIDLVAQAAVDANQNLPAGTVYDSTRSFTVQPLGQMMSGAAYEELIVAYQNEAPVRIRDIGQAIDSIQNENLFINFWNAERGTRPTVVLAVTKRSGANTVKLCSTIIDMLPELSQQIPQSMEVSVIQDGSQAIKASVADVEWTLVIAFALVVLVIFLFLGNIRSTIIPSITLPLSVVGTFLIMAGLGYSIDILSMLGLTLVIGFLVDDAIVVLENTLRHIEMGKSGLVAALDGSKQISTTVLSMTLSLAAVFIPFVFMPGIIGKMFHEFAVVVVVAVLLSGLLSLTLTPLLCSRVLKQHAEQGRLEQWAHALMESLHKVYLPALEWVLNRRWVAIGAAGLSLLLAALLFHLLPQDFLPPGDTGVVQGITVASEAISPLKLNTYQEEVTKAIQQSPYVESIISASNTGGSHPANQGVVYAILKPEKKRPAIDKVIQGMLNKTGEIPGIQTYLKPLPQLSLDVSTGATRANYAYAMSSVGNPDELYELAGEMAQRIGKIPGVVDVSSDVQAEAPQLVVDLLRDQASTYGITSKKIEQAFQLGYAEGRLGYYNTPLSFYWIIMEMEDRYRSNPDSLKKIYLSTLFQETSVDSGQKLVPLDQVIKVREAVGPLTVNHLNQFPSATLYFNLKPGYALGPVTEQVDQIADELLPRGIMRQFQGSAQVFKQTLGPMIGLIILGISAIYLLLGVLYESFIHPITILSALPGALFGALLILFLFQAPLSLYAYVGMIVLIGIVMKNGIMLVEFANEEIGKGATPYDAIVSACRIRFRPILMTTIAAAMGAVPIALGFGADAASRRPLGLAILGGLLFAQFITYFFTPVVYLSFERLQERWTRRSHSPTNR